jgi:hypothetical protein
VFGVKVWDSVDIPTVRLRQSQPQRLLLFGSFNGTSVEWKRREGKDVARRTIYRTRRSGVIPVVGESDEATADSGGERKKAEKKNRARAGGADAGFRP